MDQRPCQDEGCAAAPACCLARLQGVCGWRETRNLRHPLATGHWVRATVADQSRSETTRRGRGNSGRECRRTHMSMAPWLHDRVQNPERKTRERARVAREHLFSAVHMRARCLLYRCQCPCYVLRGRWARRVGRAIRRRAEWCCHGTVCWPRQRPRARSVDRGSVAVASRGTRKSLKLEPACCLLASCEPRQNGHVRASGGLVASQQLCGSEAQWPVASGAFGAPSDRVRTACAPNRPPMAQKSKLSRAVVVASARRRPWKGFLEGAEASRLSRLN